ncbi:hypothetical protein F53441_5388 [Fusarium austroafricanum]|uniref:Uncharacterized protein n=1 Tax=Fusarium austroafricanum TaxID=2364996 RepID=A0A8H4NUG8_9HYPO|nr:hypothetical protein F53441_5388 [Fusarium austroafricanum]
MAVKSETEKAEAMVLARQRADQNATEVVEDHMRRHLSITESPSSPEPDSPPDSALLPASLVAQPPSPTLTCGRRPRLDIDPNLELWLQHTETGDVEMPGAPPYPVPPSPSSVPYSPSPCEPLESEGENEQDSVRIEWKETSKNAGRHSLEVSPTLDSSPTVEESKKEVKRGEFEPHHRDYLTSPLKSALKCQCRSQLPSEERQASREQTKLS